MAISVLDYGHDGGHDTVPSTSRTLTLPAGTLADDLFVIEFAHQSSAAVTVTQSSGGGTLTEVVAPVGATTGTIATSVHLWKAPATPPATVGFTLGTSVEGSLSWIRLRGVDTTTPLDVTATKSPFSSATTWTAASMTTVTDGAYVVGGGNCASGTRVWTSPAGWTQAVLAPDRQGYLATKGAQTTAGATGSFAPSVDSTALQGMVWQVALRPATVAPPTADTLFTILGINPTAPATSLRFSVKTANTVSARVKIGTDAAVTAGVLYSAAATPDGSGWSQHTITGLTANTSYYYRVEMTDASSNVTLSTVIGPIKTLPDSGSIKIAHGSCLETGSSNTVFNRVKARNPDMFLHLGDWNYDNLTSTSQATWLASYEGPLSNNASLRNLVATVPSLYIVSDHDSGPNGGMPGTHTPVALAAYRQFWPSTTQGTDSVYDAMVLLGGAVRMYWTDDRRERTTTQYLPAAQVTWMQGQLTQSEPLKLWVQQGPWNGPDPANAADTPTLAPASGGDKWWNYGPTNGDQHGTVAAWIAANAVGRVITLHADSHTLNADDGTNSPGGIPTIGAAPFDKPTSIKGGPYSQGYYPNPTGAQGQQYGITTITVDTGLGTVTTAYTGYDSSDTARTTLTDTTNIGSDYSVSGTTTATSTSSGTPRLRTVAQGTTTATSTTSATPLLLAVAAGSVTVHSTSSGAVTVVSGPATYALSGAVEVVSGSAGTVALLAPLEAVIACTSSSSGTVAVMIYVFTPPGRQIYIITNHPLFDRLALTVGITLLGDGSGTYVPVNEVTDEQVAGSAIAYIGGHTYEVTSDEAARLTAAGYGTYLTHGSGI